MTRNNVRKARVLKRDFKEKRPNEWDQDRRRPLPDGGGYEETVTSNAAFEEYYQRQGVVPAGEWDAFMACLRRPLPTTFRINGGGSFAAQLRHKLEHDFFAKLAQEGPSEVDGEPLLPPQPLPWYPDKLAWQLTYSRTQLRKVPALAAVHELLKQENTAGGISRQEAVSMVPPLLLDVQPHHKVLDTCASPGSKTAQMLEMLHAAGGVPAGFVVANDIEPARCNLLVHQTKRMRSPALVVTNHDAATFPLIAPRGAGRAEAMRFDRILCDVPCSGDGTLRKAADIWRKWNVVNGTGLHPLQVRITLHNAQLLRVGGRMVYSTCSLNPVEDEAVVAEVLRQSGGALQLVDMTASLPKLKRCAGMLTWLVKGSKNQYFTSYAEAEEAIRHNNFSPSMFPPAGAEEPALPLERCMRVLPHHGDTGGFFIAVLDKVAELPPVQPERWKRTKDKRWEERKAHAKAWQQAAEAAAAGAAATAPGPDDSRKAGAGGDAEREQAQEAGSSEAAALAPVDGSADPQQERAADSGTGNASDEGTAGDAAAAGGDPARVQPEGTAGSGGGSTRPKRERPPKPGDEPLAAVTDAALLARLAAFFGLPDDLSLRSQLVARVSAAASAAAGARKLYLVTDGVREVLARDEGHALRITSAGLKVFERNDKKDPYATGCPYRIAQEGLGLLLPFMRRQTLSLSASDVLRLLRERALFLPPEQRMRKADAGAAALPPAKRARTEGGADSAEVPAAGLQAELEAAEEVSVPASDGPQAAPEPPPKQLREPLSDPDALRQLDGVNGGCVVCMLRDADARRLGLDRGDAGADPVACVAWRGRASLSLMVDKAEAARLAEELAAALAAHAAPATSDVAAVAAS